MMQARGDVIKVRCGDERLRYFTLAWWCGDHADDGTDPVADYARYVAAIRHRLPPDLLALQESVSLHDTRLRQWTTYLVTGTVRLELDSHAGDERFTLTYSGVERVESTADPAIGLRGPFGYGDLGYEE